MELKRGLVRGIGDAEAVRRAAEAGGWTVFVLPRGIADRVAFFEAVKATLPLDPPLMGSSSWDALSDSVWQGLYDHAASRIAIVWMDSSSMSEHELARDVLEDVAVSLADTELTCGKPKEVCVVID